MPDFSEIRRITANLKQTKEEYHQVIFRGHECFKFKLLPRAFRQTDIDKMRSLFNINNKEIQSWFFSAEIIDHIDLWARGARKNPNSSLGIQRLRQYCFYLMLLNHSLSVFAQKNSGEISNKDKKTLQLRCPGFWREKSTFHYLFTSYFPRIIQRYDLYGNLIHDAIPHENLSGIDETLPQHYGSPTAALDWSLNPLVALYFALGNCKNINGYMMVYAFSLKPDEINPPIKLIDKSTDIENIRATRQEGTFTYFTKPCSFYLENGELPSMNYFHNRANNGLDRERFNLKEFRIERTSNNINYLSDMLQEAGITNDYLLPE